VIAETEALEVKFIIIGEKSVDGRIDFNIIKLFVFRICGKRAYKEC
jgi:hypothetical protein